MKKKITISAVLLLASSILVILLYTASYKKNHQANGFTRVFSDQPIRYVNILDLKYNSYYIAGVTSDNIYLGNTTAPELILVTTTTLADTHFVQINKGKAVKLLSSQINVDSPYLYVTDGIKYSIYFGKLDFLSLNEFESRHILFAEVVPINNTSFITRTFSNAGTDYVFAKVTNKPPYIKKFDNLLEKQVEGMFSTDGMLHYSHQMALLVYTYYYRNQFICMDTNLNLLYRGNTIDTNTQAKIKVANIISNHSITLSAPPIVINRNSSIWRDQLFIQSDLMADNEDKKMFIQSSVIDVYNLKTGKYRISFYLTNPQNRKIKNFEVYNGNLVAIYDHYLIKYKLDKRYVR